MPSEPQEYGYFGPDTRSPYFPPDGIIWHIILASDFVGFFRGKSSSRVVSPCQ